MRWWFWRRIGSAGVRRGAMAGKSVPAFGQIFGKVEKSVGLDDARKLFAIAEEGKALIRERVQRYGIDCNLKWGYLHAALKIRHVEELKEDLDEAQHRFGYDKLRLVDRDEVRRMVDSPIYVGGLYDAAPPCPSAQLLPRRGQGRIPRLACGSSRTPKVERLEFGKPAMSCSTQSGRVTADFVVLAGNAYLGGLVPSIQSRVMPVGTYIGATTPLGENRAKACVPDDIAVVDTNFGINYFRRSADHRMLFRRQGQLFHNHAALPAAGNAAQDVAGVPAT